MLVKGNCSWCMLEECVKEITMQGFILLAITAAEKCTLFQDSM